MSAVLDAPTMHDNHYEKGIIHWTQCHDHNTSLCGLDITNEPWTPDMEIDCKMCIELEEFHCGCDCGCCDG